MVLHTEKAFRRRAWVPPKALQCPSFQRGYCEPTSGTSGTYVAPVGRLGFEDGEGSSCFAPTRIGSVRTRGFATP